MRLPKPPSDGGIGPKSLFIPRFKVTRFLRLPIASGMGPERLLRRNDKDERFVHAAPIQFGKPPDKVALSMLIDCRFVKLAKVSGIGPEMLLAPMLRLVKFMAPMHGGMMSVKSLLNKSKVCKDVDSQNCDTGPVN